MRSSLYHWSCRHIESRLIPTLTAYSYRALTDRCASTSFTMGTNPNPNDDGRLEPFPNMDKLITALPVITDPDNGATPSCSTTPGCARSRAIIGAPPFTPSLALASKSNHTATTSCQEHPQFKPATATCSSPWDNPLNMPKRGTCDEQSSEAKSVRSSQHLTASCNSQSALGTDGDSSFQPGRPLKRRLSNSDIDKGKRSCTSMARDGLNALRDNH